MDAGQVAAAREDLALERLRTAWGAGVRFHGPAFTAIRLDIARGPDGIRLVVAAGPPF
jgi:outer membrane translocation and assembly module TamA